MNQAATALLAMTCFLLCALGQAQAQGQIAVGFVNKTDTPLAVSAYSVVNGRKTPTTVLVVPKNGAPAFETRVPANAIRYYTIHDYTQPNRILLGPVPRLLTGNMNFRIVPSPLDPKKVLIEPFTAP